MMHSHRDGRKILVCDFCHHPLKNAAGRYKRRAQVTKIIADQECHFHKLCWETGGGWWRPSRRRPSLETVAAVLRSFRK